LADAALQTRVLNLVGKRSASASSSQFCRFADSKRDCNSDRADQQNEAKERSDLAMDDANP
jgi:hypothetical protein